MLAYKKLLVLTVSKETDGLYWVYNNNLGVSAYIANNNLGVSAFIDCLSLGAHM